MASQGLPILAVVIPCYNEEEALPTTLSAVGKLLDGMASEGLVSPESFALCVDDGSRDATWQTILRMSQQCPRYRGISLAHNRGHQFALLAGLMEARRMCDMAISIDADMQDDPAAMAEMARLYRQGCDIVYGVRSSRESDTWFKRATAHAFYKFQRMMGVDSVFDHADYRLMSRRALDILSEYGESNLFLRGIIPQIGLKTAIVEYKRNPRVAGESKYPLGKMISFSIDGITSFSTKPIRLIFIVGLCLLLLDIAMSVYVLISHFCGETLPGWTSIMLSIWFLGSLILMGLGIVGEYIGKIYLEVKHRPRYDIAARTPGRQ